MSDFFGGAHPPAGLINPDYKQQPSNLENVLHAGKDTIVSSNTEELEKKLKK